MKVTIIQQLGMHRLGDNYYYRYLCRAENGIVDVEEADIFIRVGQVFNLPDEEWSPESDIFTMQCDKCGHIYSKRSIVGHTVRCPICNTEEVIK